MIKRNSKLKNGYKTEEIFVLKCLENDISISRPIFNIEPYDFIVEKGNIFYSVQVKKAWIDNKNRNIVCLKSAYPRSAKTRVASQDEKVNFVAILTDEGDWYIIPRKEIMNIKSGISVSKKGKYAKYINNFDFKN